MKPSITIIYCPQCGWLLRAAWIAQELLTTFVEELERVSLQPSEISGVYQIILTTQNKKNQVIENEVIFDRKEAGHFPEPKEIKQIIRNKIAPEKSLGHSDR